jgi:hypothetical protein
MAAAFFLTLPGPKMIWQFGELGYDKSINLCEDGSINDACRLSPKPIRWDYYENDERRKLYDTYKALLRLRNSHPAFTSEESDIHLDLEDATKRITISHPEMEAGIIGNFGVKDDNNARPEFAQSGRWFEFFSGDTLNIIDTDTTISLNAGEFRLYTTEKFEAPEGDLLTGGTGVPDGDGEVSRFSPGGTVSNKRHRPSCLSPCGHYRKPRLSIVAGHTRHGGGLHGTAQRV